MLSAPNLDMISQGEFESLAQLILTCDKVYPATNQDRVEVVWRTMAIDSDSYGHPASARLATSFRYWLVHISMQMMERLKNDRGDPLAHLAGFEQLDLLAQSDETGTIPTRDDLTICVQRLGHVPRSDGVHDKEDAFDCDAEIVQESDSFAAVTQGTILGRRLFYTDSKYVGMGPQSMETDDEVWIMSGCVSPLVVRKVTQPTSGYRLLGEAYVHGVMHGEAVTEATVWEEIVLV